MLIKLKNGTWQDMSNVVGLRVALCKGMSRCYYTILVSMKNGEEFGYKECSDYEINIECYDEDGDVSETWLDDVLLLKVRDNSSDILIKCAE